MEASACWPTSTGEATVDFTGVGVGWMLSVRLNKKEGVRKL